MRVDLVAYTMLAVPSRNRLCGTKLQEREDDFDAEIWSSDPDFLAETAGRICYDSFHLPNESTATNAAYLANIRKQQHYSVLEHASFTFYVGGVSRALLAELSRHRHLSFSVRSQRYCDESKADFITPHGIPAQMLDAVGDLQRHARVLYEEIINEMTKAGASRKHAHDAARYVLPEGTATELYVTGNGRAWLEFIGKRATSHAAAEIRVLAERIYDHLREIAPATFADLT